MLEGTKFKNIDLRILPSLFTMKTLSCLIIDSKVPEKFSKILSSLNPESTLKDFFEYAYELLLNNYRTEYVFKNAIAQKILKGESKFFTELRVETSRVDVAIFNKTSHAYEIKTKLDTLKRLASQISNYEKVFDLVTILSVESKIKTIKSLIGKHIGISIVTDKYTLKTIRKAVSKPEHLDTTTMFNMLRRNEYLDIIKRTFGYVPDLPNTLIHSACENLFTTLPKNIAHKHFLEIYKNRNSLRCDFKEYPRSLKAILLEANLTMELENKLKHLLSTKIKCF